ncbi:MAG: AAA family ATPase [Deltaproteobacteria bacterium]|nr:AAA family ATPase [Deltaproteobacteria bacterium]
MPARRKPAARPAPRVVRHFAVYGKGGSGKSTVTTNLAVQLARRGLRTLQIGCDPKRDSTRSLVGGRRLRTVMDLLQNVGLARAATPLREVLFEGLRGIRCMEAGGPESGVGCAGLGIATTFKLIREHRLLEQFDAVLMDVLGDVVCGGFATPMMKGLAGGVVIVTSETPLSLYAANNISRAVKRYGRHGTYLVGLLANALQKPDGVATIEQFASAIGSRVIGVVPNDDRIRQAEKKALPVSVFAEGSDLDGVFRKLADTMLALLPGDCPPPRPLDDERFEKMFWG